MKKFMIYLMIAVAVLIANGCQKAEKEPVHVDNTIREIMMYSTSTAEELDGLPTPQPVSGVINQETGEINFPIPSEYRPRVNSEGKKVIQFDPKRIKLRANVGYDVRITPALTGIHDLSGQFEIDVLAVQTGKTKHYSLHAYFKRD